MKSVVLGIILCNSLMFAACTQQNNVNLDAEYNREIADHRAQLDSMFRISKNSPFYKHKNFTHLNFYEPDVRFRIKIKAQTTENPEIVQFQTNTERKPVYLKKYLLVFNLIGKQDTLWGFVKNETPNDIFVPFKDLTNGKQTYYGGRYMDLKFEPNSDSVWLDFNKAYNPYCHYDTGFSCPLVPFENHLSLAIEAGEKLYH
ncbi:MAG: DUF1684 domain-containing protein [Bacteroidia bacterium]|nr:DUF1684 domain-containing protein [Bacteroidia bacterium]